MALNTLQHTPPADAGAHLRARPEDGRGTQTAADEGAAAADACAEAAAPLTAEPFVWVEPSRIRPRRWVLGRVLLRENITLLVAQGGAGKTTLGIGAGLSMASGRGLIGEHVFERAGAWIFNLEDPREEMQRRIAAAMLHHGLGEADVEGRLFLNSGRDRPLVIARRSDTGVVFPDKARLVEEAKRLRIGLIVVDPFVACHALEENSNNDMNEAARAWAQVANDADCAVLLVHHTRKTGAGGHAADIEASRGGKALSDAARVGLTLATMTEDEAEALDIPPEERRRYVRMDDAKVNLAPQAGEARWYRLHGVPLNNADPLYPNGDNVQAIERWFPPKPFDDVEDGALHACLDAIEAGPGEGHRYGASKRGGSRRYVGPVIEETLNKSPAQAEAILKAWLKSGLLIERSYRDPDARRDAMGLEVDTAKRPPR